MENEVKNQFVAFKLPANKLFHAGYPNHKTLIGIPWFFEFDNPYDMAKPAGVSATFKMYNLICFKILLAFFF